MSKLYTKYAYYKMKRRSSNGVCSFENTVERNISSISNEELDLSKGNCQTSCKDVQYDADPSVHIEDPEDDEQDHDPYFRYRMSKQACLIGAWICMGLTSEMSGPTLPDLKDRIGVNYEEISRSMVGKSIGVLIGSMCGGYLHEVIPSHSDLLNTISLVMMSVAAFLLPWSVSVITAAMAFFLHGLGHGSVQIGGNTLVMHLWQKNAASAIHSLQFGFGVGALLSPQIASPFLSKKEIPDTAMNNSEKFMIPDLFKKDMSRIEIPYSIAGTVVFIFSIVLLIFYLKGEPEGFENRKASKFCEMTSPGSCTSGNNIFGMAIFICLFNYFIHGVGGEKAYGKFLFSYAFEKGILHKSEAYLLQSTFWCSFTIGRLLGIPLSRYLSIKTILIGDLCLILISTSFLAAFAGSHQEVLWTFTVIMGMGIARIFPNGMAWANLHLNMNSMGVLIIVFGGATGDFVYQYLTGYLFETVGPHSLMYVMVGYGICLTCCCFILALIVKIIPHKKPYELTVEMEVN